jgi:uncharacterized protein YutE (UPF0331/DUF86 family)
MYFVDRNELEARLHYIEKLLSFLGTRSSLPVSQLETLAFERAVHMTIEAILDVGNQMIDGFIMRDPGGYEDIIDILDDENVIGKDEAKLLLQWIRLRKRLITQYTQSETETLWIVYTQTQGALIQFPMRIRTYLEEQLGPVSAFRPLTDKNESSN